MHSMFCHTRVVFCFFWCVCFLRGRNLPTRTLVNCHMFEISASSPNKLGSCKSLFPWDQHDCGCVHSRQDAFVSGETHQGGFPPQGQEVVFRDPARPSSVDRLQGLYTVLKPWGVRRSCWRPKCVLKPPAANRKRSPSQRATVVGGSVRIRNTWLGTKLDEMGR